MMEFARKFSFSACPEAFDVRRPECSTSTVFRDALTFFSVTPPPPPGSPLNEAARMNNG